MCYFSPGFTGQPDLVPCGSPATPQPRSRAFSFSKQTIAEFNASRSDAFDDATSRSPAFDAARSPAFDATRSPAFDATPRSPAFDAIRSETGDQQTIVSPSASPFPVTPIRLRSIDTRTSHFQSTPDNIAITNNMPSATSVSDNKPSISSDQFSEHIRLEPSPSKPKMTNGSLKETLEPSCFTNELHISNPPSTSSVLLFNEVSDVLVDKISMQSKLISNVEKLALNELGNKAKSIRTLGSDVTDLIQRQREKFPLQWNSPVVAPNLGNEEDENEINLDDWQLQNCLTVASQLRSLSDGLISEVRNENLMIDLYIYLFSS